MISNNDIMLSFIPQPLYILILSTFMEKYYTILLRLPLEYEDKLNRLKNTYSLKKMPETFAFLIDDKLKQTIDIQKDINSLENEENLTKEKLAAVRERLKDLYSRKETVDRVNSIENEILENKMKKLKDKMTEFYELGYISIGNEKRQVTKEKLIDEARNRCRGQNLPIEPVILHIENIYKGVQD